MCQRVSTGKAFAFKETKLNNTENRQNMFRAAGLENSQPLAKGGQASVFTAAYKNNRNVVVRYERLPGPFPDRYRQLGALGIGPVIYAAFYDDKQRMMIMEQYDYTAENLPRRRALRNRARRSSDAKWKQKVKSQLEKIHRMRYVHGDPFARNILLKVDGAGRICDATLADFGSMRRPAVGERQWERERITGLLSLI